MGESAADLLALSTNGMGEFITKYATAAAADKPISNPAITP
jgi:hypothetical protein